MYIIQKIKGIIYDNADITSVKKEKINKKVHVNELKDEIWLYKNEYNKENVNEEYDKEIDDNEYDDDENEKQPTDHFLEVPLFDEDDYGKNIKRRIVRILLFSLHYYCYLICPYYINILVYLFAYIHWFL